MQKNRSCYPMLATIIPNQRDKADAVVILWEKFKSFPQSKKDILNSEKMSDFIYGASQNYNLDDAKTEEFSRTVRQYFFNEIVDGQFARKIADLCKASNEEGLEILSSIKNIQPEREMVAKRNPVTGKIYSAPKPASTISFASKASVASKKAVKGGLSSSTAQASNIVQVPVKRALNLYPKLESQSLTESQIVSKPFLKPVKPTIKNWLTVYEELMGAGKKGAIDRGNFLFHSEAAKNLPTEDRQKLAQVLKSADEDSNLTIDTIKGEIIFPETSFNDSKQSSKKVPNSRNFQNGSSNNFGDNKFKNTVSASQKNSQPQPQIKSQAQPVSNKFSKQQTDQFNSQVASRPVSENFSGQSTFIQESALSGKDNLLQQRPVTNQQISQPISGNFSQKVSSNDSLQSQKQSSKLSDGFESKINNNDFQAHTGNFANKQGNGGMNSVSGNLGNEKIGGIGNDSPDLSQQEVVSLDDLKSSNEENVRFTSRHVLPAERNDS